MFDIVADYEDNKFDNVEHLGGESCVMLKEAVGKRVYEEEERKEHRDINDEAAFHKVPLQLSKDPKPA